METTAQKQPVYPFFSAVTLRYDVFKRSQSNARLRLTPDAATVFKDSIWLHTFTAATLFKSLKGKERAEASDLLLIMQNFKFVFIQHFTNEILSCTSTSVQAKSSGVARVVDVTDGITDTIGNVLSDQAFHSALPTLINSARNEVTEIWFSKQWKQAQINAQTLDK
jgi:2-hydroxy-3-keto-5-methylthiopentenyl-1-phosphate phosphatase